jgi:hypothetical protein
VNAAELRPGDAVLFRRGARWDGRLQPRGDGTRERPIIVGAWGDGTRPHLHGGVRLRDQSWWTVMDLELTSDPAARRCGFEAPLTADGAPRGA